MLIDLIKQNETDRALDIARSDPSGLIFKDDSGLSPIMWAAYYRNDKLISAFREIVPDGIDIFEACALNMTDKVIGLLKNDPLLVSNYSPDGFQPLGLACFLAYEELAELLVENGGEVDSPSNNSFKVRPIHSAVAAGNANITELLLTHGADPNAPQQKNIRPIHSACHNGNTSILSLLIKFGADPNATDDEGKNAREYAKDPENSEEVIALLGGTNEPPG